MQKFTPCIDHLLQKNMQSKKSTNQPPHSSQKMKQPAQITTSTALVTTSISNHQYWHSTSYHHHQHRYWHDQECCLTCGSAAWHLTEATVLVWPVSVWMQAFIRMSHTCTQKQPNFSSCFWEEKIDCKNVGWFAY